eukprot:GFUD01129097.1.p1 GENE.GFUD01129097.1~~GFUD01129097.1.p1  ORF type:complete len:757 (-),score=228.74 GFUD01129097.1:250-2439(-)
MKNAIAASLLLQDSGQTLTMNMLGQEAVKLMNHQYMRGKFDGISPKLAMKGFTKLDLSDLSGGRIRFITDKVAELKDNDDDDHDDLDSSDEEDEEEKEVYENISDSQVFEKCFQGNDTRIWSAITSICKIDVKKIDLEHTKIANKEEVLTKIANKDEVLRKKSVVDLNLVKTETEVQLDDDDENHLEVFNCEECNFDCDSREGLNRHMKLHDPSREFPCDECGLRFMKERHVFIHARIHTGEKPFSCDLCMSCFAESWSLKLHMSKHDVKRKFVCSYCTLRFKSNIALKVHIEKQHSVKNEEIDHNSDGSNNEENGGCEEEENVQASTSSSAYFGGGKPTSAGLAWLDSVKHNSGRRNSRCSDRESQDSSVSGSREGSASLRGVKSRERTSSPNIEDVGWRKNKPRIKMYHPMKNKLKSSPESLDHNYSSGPEETKNDSVKRRKLSKEFLESKEDLVKPFTLKIKKSNRSWLDERSESDGEDEETSCKKLRLEWSEESNDGIDVHGCGNTDTNDSKNKKDESANHTRFSIDEDDKPKPRPRRSTRGMGVRVSLDEDDKVWCLKMKNVGEGNTIAENKVAKEDVQVEYKSPNSLILDKDLDEDVSVLSPYVPEVKDEEIIDLLSESDQDNEEENEVFEKNKEDSESVSDDDFSIRSEDVADPIDDLLDDSGSETGKSGGDPTKYSVSIGPGSSSKHATDHDYSRDDSEDETCSEYEDLFVSDHEDRGEQS